jgi:hypothetical protein
MKGFMIVCIQAEVRTQDPSNKEWQPLHHDKRQEPFMMDQTSSVSCIITGKQRTCPDWGSKLEQQRMKSGPELHAAQSLS